MLGERDRLGIPARADDLTRPGVRRLAVADDRVVRVVFALDRCTDQTEQTITQALAPAGKLDERFEIVRIAHCPDGWAGKTHAAWRGVQDSRGPRSADFLLFTDADTIFDPSLIRSAVALALQRGIGLLSLLSELTCEGWWERLVQPATGFELIRQHPLDMVNREHRPRAFANGQFMLFRRADYERLGGHEAVRHELLEDIAFARKAEADRRTSNMRWAVLMPGRLGPDAPGLLRCRMYPTWEGFVRGWKRIYTESSLRRPSQLSEWAWRSRLMGAVLPVSALGCVLAGPVVFAAGDRPLGLALTWVGALSWSITMGCLARVYRDQGVPERWALAYPAGAWLTARILSSAADDLRAGRKTVWGGKEYART